MSAPRKYRRLDGLKSIMVGTADKMLVVGAESAICEVGIGGFAAMKALSTRNDDPQTASRPFDAERNGFVMGEGGAALVLEEYESAVARGATIYAELAGFGESGDANHITTPSLEGPLRAMKAAYKMAGEPKVDYVNAHGTSTVMNDKTETLAIQKAFNNRSVSVSSTKSMTGHLLGGAGGIEMVFTALSIYEDMIPPTINYENPDEDCDLDYVPNTARSKKVEYAMTNSFGFGGTNATLILKKYKE